MPELDIGAFERVKNLLSEARQSGRTGNPPILMSRILKSQREMNGGFPCDMHHPTLPSLQVFTMEEKAAVEGQGYRDEYRHRSFPKMLYRRNLVAAWGPMDTRWVSPQAREKPLDREERIEWRIVENEAQELQLLNEKPHAGYSAWVVSLNDLDPLPDEDTEDPAIKIAKLQGQLAEAQRGQMSDTENIAVRSVRRRH